MSQQYQTGADWTTIQQVEIVSHFCIVKVSLRKRRNLTLLLITTQLMIR